MSFGTGFGYIHSEYSTYCLLERFFLQHRNSQGMCLQCNFHPTVLQFLKPQNFKRKYYTIETHCKQFLVLLSTLSMGVSSKLKNFQKLYTQTNNMKQKLLKPSCSLHTSKPYTFCHTTLFHCMTIHHLNVIFSKEQI